MVSELLKTNKKKLPDLFVNDQSRYHVGPPSCFLFFPRQWHPHQG